MNGTGRITRIAGPVVGATGLTGVRLNDVVLVGHHRLVGEVIRLSGTLATIQVYEETSGIGVGEPVCSTGRPLVAALGPGLLGRVYDGLQRPLPALAALSGHFIERGLVAPALPTDVRWPFSPAVVAGDRVEAGQVLGTMPESTTITHRVLVPPGVSGRVASIEPGNFTASETVATIEPAGNHHNEPVTVTLCQFWPVRQPRPARGRLVPREPLITGTRIIDALFPVARGGAAIIPGGFGTGKTVTEQSLARWADADVVVYVGCGERGNEMTDVLEEFPQLEDPRSGAPLMDRTVLIANTSNMPVAAREASIYMGMTIAEYYRDMGYDVLLLADSTSRWGEALREISGRLEEMPGEEGYPAYLGARLAEFYERAGRVTCLGGQKNDSDQDERCGSVTIVGAVSPPGGDFSEPMTQNSMRVAGTFWALDYDLSRRRHFPAINWTRSYSLYDLRAWYAREVAPDWNELAGRAMALLQREVELLEIVQLVGPDALAESERAELAAARMLREDFLQQSAADEIDRYCPVDKAYWMLVVILTYYALMQKGPATGVALDRVMSLEVVEEIARLKRVPAELVASHAPALIDRIHTAFAGIGIR